MNVDESKVNTPDNSQKEKLNYELFIADRLREKLNFHLQFPVCKRLQFVRVEQINLSWKLMVGIFCVIKFHIRIF